MSELLLTLLLLGFLALIWLLVIVAVLVLRRDLKAPRDARMLVPARAPRAGGAAPKAPKAPKQQKAAKGGARSLVVVEGPLTGTVIPLGTADVTIGRAPDSLKYSVALTTFVGENETDLVRRGEAAGRSLESVRSDSNIWGTAADAAAKVSRLADLGAERVYFQLLDLQDLDQLEYLGSEVLPLLP